MEGEEKGGQFAEPEARASDFVVRPTKVATSTGHPPCVTEWYFPKYLQPE